MAQLSQDTHRFKGVVQKLKRVFAAILTLVLLLALTACGDKNVTIDTAALESDINGAGLFVDTLVKLSDATIGGQVETDVSGCTSKVYYAGMGATAEEWGVFECASAKDAKALKTALETHRDNLLTTYSSYAPDAVPRIQNAVIRQKGQYVLFITAEKYDDAAKIADKYFS